MLHTLRSRVHMLTILYIPHPKQQTACHFRNTEKLLRSWRGWLFFSYFSSFHPQLLMLQTTPLTHIPQRVLTWWPSSRVMSAMSSTRSREWQPRSSTCSFTIFSWMSHVCLVFVQYFAKFRFDYTMVFGMKINMIFFSFVGLRCLRSSGWYGWNDRREVRSAKLEIPSWVRSGGRHQGGIGGGVSGNRVSCRHPSGCCYRFCGCGKKF